VRMACSVYSLCAVRCTRLDFKLRDQKTTNPQKHSENTKNDQKNLITPHYFRVLEALSEKFFVIALLDMLA